MAIVERAQVRIEGDPPRAWPFDIPCIRQICEQGLELDRGVTILVGENGSGKSTLVEALAEAYGIDVRGGHGARRHAPAEATSRCSTGASSSRVSTSSTSPRRRSPSTPA